MKLTARIFDFVRASRGTTAVFAVMLGFALLLGANAPAYAKHKRHHVHYEYECRTGWWMVRDGHRFWRPSDGMWRPSWTTRCMRVPVRHIEN